jgi:phosphatidylglycerol:prolipoprotein diacylglycerol transferase
MIEIDISSFIFDADFVSSVTVSWHGFFSFVAVATAVLLVGRWAPLYKLDPDDVLSVAVWAIIGGVIGARVVHVIDNWDAIYTANPARIFYIWQGGIAVWGAILGGFIGGAAYAFLAEWWERRKRRNNPPSADGEVPRAKFPVGALADLTAPALLFVQSIGRVGDIINGEHCAKATEHFFGFQWVHPETAARICANGVTNGAHPVIILEMAWNMVALAVIWQLRGRLKPAGMLFALYIALYSIGRFGVSFLREDRIWALGMQEAHYISLLMLVITVPLLAIKARLTDRVEDAPAVFERGTRADRRRRQRKA